MASSGAVLSIGRRMCFQPESSLPASSGPVLTGQRWHDTINAFSGEQELGRAEDGTPTCSSFASLDVAARYLYVCTNEMVLSTRSAWLAKTGGGHHIHHPKVKVVTSCRCRSAPAISPRSSRSRLRAAP